MDKALRVLSWLNILAGIILLVSIRIKGYGLTEGEIFIKFAPYWMAMAASIVVGYIGIHMTGGKK